MLRESRTRLRWVVFGLVWAFVFVTVPIDLIADPAESTTGSVSGFLYKEDWKTPVKGAVMTFRNISTKEEFKCEPTDATGAYKTPSLPSGLYSVSARVEGKDHTFEHVVQLKVNTNQNSEVSFALPGKKHAGLILLLAGGSAAVVTGVVIATRGEEEVSSPAK